MENITKKAKNWNETKRKLKKRFAILTDNDVMLIQGKHEELIGRLQTKLGKTKEQIHKLIAEL